MSSRLCFIFTFWAVNSACSSEETFKIQHPIRENPLEMVSFLHRLPEGYRNLFVEDYHDRLKSIILNTEHPNITRIQAIELLTYVPDLKEDDFASTLKNDPCEHVRFALFKIFVRDRLSIRLMSDSLSDPAVIMRLNALWTLQGINAADLRREFQDEMKHISDVDSMAYTIHPEYSLEENFTIKTPIRENSLEMVSFLHRLVEEYRILFVREYHDRLKSIIFHTEYPTITRIQAIELLAYVPDLFEIDYDYILKNDPCEHMRFAIFKIFVRDRLSLELTSDALIDPSAIIRLNALWVLQGNNAAALRSELQDQILNLSRLDSSELVRKVAFEIVRKLEIESDINLVRMIDWNFSSEEMPNEFRYLLREQSCVSASVIGPNSPTTFRGKKLGLIISQDAGIVAASRKNMGSGLQYSKESIQVVLKRCKFLEFVHVNWADLMPGFRGEKCSSNRELVRKVHEVSHRGQHNEILLNMEWKDVVALFVVNPTEEEKIQVKNLAATVFRQPIPVFLKNSNSHKLTRF